MQQVILHTGPSGLAHTLLDTAVSVGLGVVLVGLYLFVLRYYVGSDGRGVR